jgi:prepilin-type processing-associated H-X9-DG protein
MSALLEALWFEVVFAKMRIAVEMERDRDGHCSECPVLCRICNARPTVRFPVLTDGSPENAMFNDAQNMVSFVDGHVSYTKIFWTDTFAAHRVRLVAGLIDPPEGYEYQWHGD